MLGTIVVFFCGTFHVDCPLTENWSVWVEAKLELLPTHLSKRYTVKEVWPINKLLFIEVYLVKGDA